MLFDFILTMASGNFSHCFSASRFRDVSVASVGRDDTSCTIVQLLLTAFTLVLVSHMRSCQPALLAAAAGGKLSRYLLGDWPARATVTNTGMLVYHTAQRRLNAVETTCLTLNED